ncbi:MAG: hypothetical protein ABR507_00490 [Actinomycetota bacterium]
MSRILYVCTGNICRSPMAAAIALSTWAPFDPSLTVMSAGIMRSGLPATKEAQQAMVSRGMDISSHVSTSLSRALSENSFDLIVGMERRHVRKVLEHDLDLLAVTFNLIELAGRTQGTPRTDQETLRDYLDRIGEGRRPSMYVGERLEEDIEDPFGQSYDVYEATADLLTKLIDEMVDSLWPANQTNAPNPLRDMG